MRKIKLIDGISIASPYPAIYLEQSRSLVISDLHLGGPLNFAIDSFSIVSQSTISPARDLGCRTVFILGDLKHSFGRMTRDEMRLLTRYLQDLRHVGAEPVIVRGNHDKYLSALLGKLQVKLVSSYVTVSDRFILTHGHKKISKLPKGSNLLATIIGHEHPAVSLRNASGHKEKFKTFLDVPIDQDERKVGKHLLVLPSVNPFAYGTPINEANQAELLSPYLKSASKLDRAKPYVIDVGRDVMPFPELRLLKKIAA